MSIPPEKPLPGAAVPPANMPDTEGVGDRMGGEPSAPAGLMFGEAGAADNGVTAGEIGTGAGTTPIQPPSYALPRDEEPIAAKTFWYCLANLGYGMFFALNNATLTLFLKNMGAHGVLIGLMGSSHSLEGAVIQPLVGTASDRLRTPLGRRRPFILAFTPLSSLFLLLTPAASHLPGSVRLAGVVVCIFLFTVFFNVAQDPYMALMPDIIPPAKRGRVTGIWTFVGVIGQATLVLLPPSIISLPQKFSLVAVVMLITTLLTCLGVREPTHPPETDKPGALAQIRLALYGLNTLQQARKSLGALFFTGVGVGAVLPFLTVFVTKITHCTDHQAESMFLVLMISTAVGVLPFGWLCDRFGPKNVLMIGLALLVIAALNGLWVQTLGQVSIVLMLAGLGNAAQSASAYPLLTRLVPREEVGFYTGLQSTALSIAAPVTSVGHRPLGGSRRVSVDIRGLRREHRDCDGRPVPRAGRAGGE